MLIHEKKQKNDEVELKEQKIKRKPILASVYINY